MGTNYYAKYNVCKGCKRYETIHIGKSSVGWTFSFHATEEIRSCKDWINFLRKEKAKIFDEYENKITLCKFKKLVHGLKGEIHNHAVEYPEGSFLDTEGNSMSNGEFS
jgi:hypothetical protein